MTRVDPALIGGEPAGLPPEITGRDPGSYAHGVLTRRHPTIVAKVRAAHPYGPRQLGALDALEREITDGTVGSLPPGSPGAAEWATLAAPYLGARWSDLPFLWGEGYFYTRLLTAVDYWGPAPWTGTDPFAGMKGAELASDAYAADLAAVPPPGAGGLPELVLGAVWGNRADLGFLVDADPGATGARSHLVADDSPALVERLAGGRVRRLCVLADNTGQELLADLVLLDRLLHNGSVREVELHLKPHPYFVSDATLADLLAVLRTLAAGPPGARALWERLDGLLRTGRLRPATHWFSGLPYGYARMPADLRAHLGTFDLVLAKGDLNYRRLVGDRHWSVDTPFASAARDFPAPVAALRTVKSDVLVGGYAEAARLDTTAPGWRTTGRYALVQLAG